MNTYTTAVQAAIDLALADEDYLVGPIAPTPPPAPPTPNWSSFLKAINESEAFQVIYVASSTDPLINVSATHFRILLGEAAQGNPNTRLLQMEFDKLYQQVLAPSVRTEMQTLIQTFNIPLQVP